MVQFVITGYRPTADKILTGQGFKVCTGLLGLKVLGGAQVLAEVLVGQIPRLALAPRRGLEQPVAEVVLQRSAHLSVLEDTTGVVVLHLYAVQVLLTGDAIQEKVALPHQQHGEGGIEGVGHQGLKPGHQRTHCQRGTDTQNG